MAEENYFTKATWRIMEQLLEVDDLEQALAGSLEIIVDTLQSEAGAIWFLDESTNRLTPLFHIGPADISNISIENGIGIEGIVTSTGKSVIVSAKMGDIDIPITHMANRNQYIAGNLNRQTKCLSGKDQIFP